MGENLRPYDKIILGGVTIFALYLGIGQLFINFPWGICGTVVVFIIWAIITRAYTYAFVEGRPIQSGDWGPEYDLPEEEPEVCWDDSRWIIDPDRDSPVPESQGEGQSRLLTAAVESVSSSRIILGPTPAGGEMCEPKSEKWESYERKEDRETADMFRAL